MNIETKANVGSKVYFLRKIETETCPICAGRGMIRLGNPIPILPGTEESVIESVAKQAAHNIEDAITGNCKKYKCPECKGKKVVKVTGQAKYEVGEASVLAINIFTGLNGINMTYLIEEGNKTHTIGESELWTNRDQAEKRCKFLNLERKFVSADKIKIPSCFATTIPHNLKLVKRLNEWRSKKQFDTEIYVNEKLELFDGYTAYLIYKMLGVRNIPVVIWPNKSN